MIVSHKMAVEAAKALDVDIAAPGFDEAVVQLAYRSRAKLYHPDKPGGDQAKFVEADRAKCLLLGWLEKQAQAEAVDPAVSSLACPMCHGTGRRTLRRGFHSMTMMCGTCRGHGEMVPHEKVEE